MSCAFPQWRMPESALLNNGWCRHYLYDRFAKRIHNKGVILQRDEYETLSKEYPFLASQIDQIPCGKCIQCRLSRSRDWANRCMLELKSSENAYFITLTYDDQNLNFAPFVDVESGETCIRPVLVPSELQKFMKRLRRWCSRFTDLKQKFYACGEYGELTSRPHYHLIVYNLPSQFEEGAHIWDQSSAGTPLWTSKPLSQLWPFGLACYGEVNWSTCAYVARYVMKKRLGRSRQDQKAAQEKIFPGQPWQEEFTRMSLRPAIGRDYYDQNKHKIYSNDEVFVNVKGDIQSVKPSRYYDRLYDLEDHFRLRHLKLQRKKVAAIKYRNLFSQIDLSEEEYLLLTDKLKQDQAKRLIRPSI